MSECGGSATHGGMWPKVVILGLLNGRDIKISKVKGVLKVKTDRPAGRPMHRQTDRPTTCTEETLSIKSHRKIETIMTSIMTSFMTSHYVSNNDEKKSYDLGPTFTALALRFRMSLSLPVLPRELPRRPQQAAWNQSL